MEKANMSTLYLAFLALYFSLSATPSHQAPPSGGAPTDGMCAYAVPTQGYTCKEYSVTTDDGYILSVQRISGAAGGTGNDTRPQPVLLQHGLFADGKCFLMNSPKQSLALILADNGFDVWVSNFRGTRYSRRHKSLKPNLPKFWDWTWSDLASHDVPAVTDLVFKETGQQMHYVGHSMGTLVAFALLSEGKFANVKSAVLLSPIAYLSHTTSSFVQMGSSSFPPVFGGVDGGIEFNHKGPMGTAFIRRVCNMVDCSNMMDATSGNDCCLEKATVAAYLANDMQSTSTKNLVHFGQNVKTGIMAHYNYGGYVNMRKYGSMVAPVYDLSKIPRDFPLMLCHGGQDALANVEDVKVLLDVIKDHDKDKLEVLFVEKYAHIDFILAANANELVYNHVVEYLRKLN